MRRLPEGLKKKILPVELLVLDCDGVLTDGSIIYTAEGVEIKPFNVRDGHGIKLLKSAGIECAVISSRTSGALAKRAEELSVDIVIQGALDKAEAYDGVLRKTGLNPSQTAYMGDDIVDLPAFARAGLKIAVADAVEELKSAADYVTAARGGKGAAREVAELLLKTKGRWPDIMKRYEGKV